MTDLFGCEPEPDHRIRGYACISEDGLYRYELVRYWDNDMPGVVWIMLNPSTADWTHDDQTIRKCIGYSMRHGFGQMIVVNLFALRATNPKDLDGFAFDPVGPDNVRHVQRFLEDERHFPLVVAAWGSSLPKAKSPVVDLLRNSGRRPCCLGLTKSGHPLHPSRPSYDLELVEYKP